MAEVIIHERKYVEVKRIIDIPSEAKVYRMPTAPRLSLRLRMVCDICGKPITGDRFIGVIMQPLRDKNLILHEECAESAGITPGRSDERS